jgi:hypothetical protein
MVERRLDISAFSSADTMGIVALLETALVFDTSKIEMTAGISFTV